MRQHSNQCLNNVDLLTKDVPVIGFTGTGGAGKSSLLDELMLRIQRDNPGKKVCLLCVDPTRKRTGWGSSW
jgi:methylmalonyl-CoA mutase